MNTTTFQRNRRSFSKSILAAALAILLMYSCNKEHQEGNGNQASDYSSEVLEKWMTIQLRLMRNATGIPNHGFSRHFAYSGIAAIESIKPGIKNNQKWLEKWNGLTGLPAPAQMKSYYFPANANAAMATINRLMFPNASAADKLAIDSLEEALIQEFLTKQDPAKINLSSAFGKAVSIAVFNWAETDGYKQANAPYTPPTGPGSWKPTPPVFTPIPATPYWGNNRPVIRGSIDNTQPVAPFSYSTNTWSSFHQMVKQVYDISQTLTDDQKAMATFWKDIPGVSSPGHWLSILQQLIHQRNTTLEYAALSYALTGSAINDALITCFRAKYHFNLVRPVTYIRDVMKIGDWNPYLGTPAHPEYPSAHSSLSVAAGTILDKLFGKKGSFTDHTYDYLGYPSRVYPSFLEIGLEAGQSRIYGGIHYQQSVEAGNWQGKKVAENIFSK